MSFMPIQSLSAHILMSCATWFRSSGVPLPFIVAPIGINILLSTVSPRRKPPFQVSDPEAVSSSVTCVIPLPNLREKLGLLFGIISRLPVLVSTIPVHANTLGAVVLLKAGRMLLPVREIFLVLFPRITGTVFPVRVLFTSVRAY